MAELELARMEKLRITAFQEAERKDAPRVEIGVFEASFNPETIHESGSNKFQGASKPGINTSTQSAHFSHGSPRLFSLTLVLDNTGAGSSNIFGDCPAWPDLYEQVEEFKQLCYKYDGKAHQPRFLVLEWSRQEIDCRLKDYGVKYTLHDRAGKPMRAELELTFLEDITDKKRDKQEAKESPDLTHVHTVIAGDSLPLLSWRFYGSSDPYLLVAKFNRLNHHRDIRPGQEINFPPLRVLQELENRTSA